MRILVVEDEERIARAIKRGLELESFAVDVAYDGARGYDLAATIEYDVIVLDLMLPQMDGVTMCKKLRREKINAPILMLTAKGQLDDKVAGFGVGADDYLVKPFAFEELLARVRALARRPRRALSQVLAVDNLTLDTLTHEVLRAGTRIELSRKEFGLLEFMMRNKGQTLTKDQIIENVWGYEADVLPNTVEVYVSYLRNKIDRTFGAAPALIHTIRGFGYRLEVDE